MPVEVVAEYEGHDEDAASALVMTARRAAAAILEEVGHSGEELCVLLVGDERMRELNRDWRGKDRPTDVLSFAQQEGEALPEPAFLLGDVVVSVDTLRRQAADGGWSDDEELVRLLLHGVLHLLGYDHEDQGDARHMRIEERRVIAKLAARGIACAADEDDATPDGAADSAAAPARQSVRGAAKGGDAAAASPDVTAPAAKGRGRS